MDKHDSSTDRGSVRFHCPRGHAAEHPNFSGTWKLNLAESDFSDKHASAPDRLVLSVHHDGDAFSYESVREKAGKKNKGHLDLSIAVVNQSGGDGAASAEWKAEKLVFKLLNNGGQPTEFEAIDTWSLSPDGKKLVSEYLVHLPNNGGDSHVRRIFDKKN